MPIPLQAFARRAAPIAATILLACASPALSATVRVGVVDESGTPVASSAVRLAFDDGMGDTGRSTLSDSEGVASFEDLLPGRYLVTSDHGETAFVRPEHTFPPTPVRIVIGEVDETVSARLLLQRGRSTHLRFTVDDSRQRHWANVVAVDLDTRQQIRARIDQDGDHTLALVPGRWNVALEPPPGLLLSELRLDGLPVGGHQVNVDLRDPFAAARIEWRFAAVARIVGQVTYDGTTAVSPIDVRASLLRPGPWFDDARRRGGSEYSGVTTRADRATGRFVLELPDGRWQLEVVGEQDHGALFTQRIDLGAGEERRLDVELEAARSHPSHQDASLRDVAPAQHLDGRREASPSDSASTRTAGHPAVTVRLYCSGGEALPRRADVRVVVSADDDDGVESDSSGGPAILSIEDLSLIGDMRDRVVAGPLPSVASTSFVPPPQSPSTPIGRPMLAVRPAGFDRWRRVAVPGQPSELTDLGAVAVDCAPRLRVSVQVTSGRPAPDLRALAHLVDAANRLDRLVGIDRQDGDSGRRGFVLQGTVRTQGSQDEKIQHYRAQHRTDAVIVRGLPPGAADLRLWLGHPFFLPEFWVELPVDGALDPGRTLDVIAVVDDVGGAIEVRAPDAVAARLIAVGGDVRRDVVRGDVARFSNLPAGSYRLETCRDAACRSLTRVWTDVAVTPLQRVELETSIAGP